MASRGAIATLDADVRERFRLVTNRLSKRLGVDPPGAPEAARQADLARVYELQAMVDWLERLDGTAKDEGYSAAPGESKADVDLTDADAEDAGVELGAEVTQDGTPVVVTEAVVETDMKAAKAAPKKKA